MTSQGRITSQQAGGKILLIDYNDNWNWRNKGVRNHIY